MASLPVIPVFGLAAFSAGVAVAFFTRRVPMRGWMAVVLLLLASTALGLIASSVPMLLTFMIIAPVAIVYSFQARRRAPDRLLALAGFAGAFFVGALLLLVLASLVAGVVHSLFVL